MTKFRVYVTGQYGESVPVELQNWDSDEGNLYLHLDALANDAVIEIEEAK